MSRKRRPKHWTSGEKSALAAAVRWHLAAGLSQAEACRAAGVAPANYVRWRDEIARRGAPAEAARPTGRPPRFDLTPEEARPLRRLRLRYDSLDLAVEAWLRGEAFEAGEALRPETIAAAQELLDRAARRRRRVRWPASLRRAGHVTDEERALYRGPKAAASIEISERRGLYWRDEDGQEWPMLPGTIFESDDMSCNEPYRYHDAELGRETLGRQGLYTLDTYSLRWLGVSLVGRERDAYRAEDIAEHLLEIVDAVGLPAIWRFERGPWDNNVINGVRLPDGSRWGGLDELFRVSQKFSSRGKANVEGGFDFLQAVSAHQSTSIGRQRGEFEAGSRHYLRAQAGRPEDLRYFWTLAQCAEAQRAAMAALNARARQRHAFGPELVVPDELWQSPVTRPLPADQRWRFCPVKKEATVRSGVIETSAPHYPRTFRFLVHGCGDLPVLDHGHALLIAFHPGRPEEGCHVFNSDRTTRNREGLRWGQYLGLAEWMHDVPQEDFSAAPDHDRRRRANAAVRAEFRAVVPPGTGPGTLRSTARDGLGNALDLARHGAPPAGLPALPARAGRPPRQAPEPEPLEDRMTRLAAAEARAGECF